MLLLLLASGKRSSACKLGKVGMGSRTGASRSALMSWAMSKSVAASCWAVLRGIFGDGLE